MRWCARRYKDMAMYNVDDIRNVIKHVLWISERVWNFKMVYDALPL